MELRSYRNSANGFQGPGKLTVTVYEELHHAYIPQRASWAPNWLKNNSLNLKPLNSIQHGIRDPYRFQFFPAEIKNAIRSGNTFGY
jgi:hypothetical protein